MKTKNNSAVSRLIKKAGASALAVSTVLGSSTVAFATIDNTAIATGTFGGGAVNSPPSTQNIPVVPLSRNLAVVKSVFSGPTVAAGSDPANTDALDTITYRYTITNTGNATETDVTPVDAGPTFNGVAAENTLSSFTEVAGGTGIASSLAPGETVVFEAVYIFAALDVYRAAGVTDGVSNIATASSDDHADPDPSPPATATIPSNPSLVLAKTFVLNDQINNDSLAEVGETITYTYTVTNNGNVPILNVGIQDTHVGVIVSPAPGLETITVEGPVQASDIGAADDGVIDQLEAGAVATFTYVHTVTQAEVDAQ